MKLCWFISVAVAMGAFIPQDHSSAGNFLDLTERRSFEIAAGDPHHGSSPEEEHAHHDESLHGLGDHVSDHGSSVQEHVDHGTKAHGSGVNGDCPGNQSTNSVAVALMTIVVLGPLVAQMAHSKACNGQIAALTLKMMDLTTSIFLAVLWFTASAEILETKFIHEMFPYSEEFFAAFALVFLYVVVMVVVYLIQDWDSTYIISFCSIAAHYVAFAGIRAGAETQHALSEAVDEAYSPYISLVFCLVVLAVLMIMSAICYYSWRRKHDESKEMSNAIEELELDIVGLVLSFAIMQALRHILTGQYPAKAHFLLLEPEPMEPDDSLAFTFLGGHGREHTQNQRWFMLLWSVGLTVFACVVLRPMEERKEQAEDEDDSLTIKVIRVAQVVLVMCVAWGYLLWGEWQFYEVYFKGDKMFGKMVFAMIATFAVLGFIIALAYATTSRFKEHKGYANLCVMALSLVAAWSWEHCFHTAINVIADQYEVGYGGVVPKIILAFGVPLVIMPGYLLYLKPALHEVEVEEEKEHEKHMLQRQESKALSLQGPSSRQSSANATAEA